MIWTEQQSKSQFLMSMVYKQIPTRSIAATVFYYLTDCTQKDAASIFDVSEVSIRSAMRKLGLKDAVTIAES